MSRENIDLHERFVAALNTREISDEIAEELIAPDCRVVNISTLVTDNTYSGVAGVRRWLGDTFDGLDEGTRYEVEEIVADGDDFVVARMCLVGHGARSGAPVLLRWVDVIRFQRGKISWAGGYARRREALKAVGLEE
jgi:ketosteroid isomerase-like protein